MVSFDKINLRNIKKPKSKAKKIKPISPKQDFIGDLKTKMITR